MQQQEIHHYLQNFFQGTGCNVISHPTHLDVDLTIEMDKQLMNRPFYWHYLEKTGGIPNPMSITLVTDGDDMDGEMIHFGSPRLQQIFSVALELGAFIRLYEKIDTTNQHIPLHPWLMMNIAVSYICDRKKEVMYSFGLHLLNGTIINDFYEKTQSISFTPKIPDYCFTLSPLIKVPSGIKRIEEKIKGTIEEDDHQWAHEATQRWEHDLQLLEKFYEDEEELPESYYVEKSALQEQYEPRIQVEFVNGGMFYMSDEQLSRLGSNDDR